MVYAVKYMVDGIVPQRKEFFTFREAHEFFDRIGNKARYLMSVDYAGNEQEILRKELPKPFDKCHVKNIMTVPCGTKINGEKQISVCNGWAYVQYADGMETYRYDNGRREWNLYGIETCANC